MYHIGQLSVRSTRKKYLGYKKLQGGKKPLRKTEKKWRPFFFFFFFFGDSKKFVGAAKNEQGAPNGNVTTLPTGLISAGQHEGDQTLEKGLLPDLYT